MDPQIEEDFLAMGEDQSSAREQNVKSSNITRFLKFPYIPTLSPGSSGTVTFFDWLVSFLFFFSPLRMAYSQLYSLDELIRHERILFSFFS